ncbi:MAG: DegV family protein [Dehalococcoidales bacterium]|nr:DegV family protein [Dehalococcoidales bacterium]
MTVKIVTDSVADLPARIAGELDIAVVPLVVNFGSEVFHDGIDITLEQFYEKLQSSKEFPHTSVPAPADFTAVYDRLAEQTDRIVVICLSAKLSGTYQVARQGITLMSRKCQVEVIDSGWAAITEGFIVIAAAKAANAGAGIPEIKEVIKQTAARIGFRASFDTLEYLRRGGRIGRAQAFLGSLLKINPIITLKDGLVEPVERVRSRAKAIDRLVDFAKSCTKIEEMAVEYTASPAEAEVLAKRLSSLFPKERILRARMTPVIGTHTGPGLLLVAVQGEIGP